MVKISLNEMLKWWFDNLRVVVVWGKMIFFISKNKLWEQQYAEGHYAPPPWLIELTVKSEPLVSLLLVTSENNNTYRY